MSDIRFGTDGWRAVIAEDFTYDNVRRVADAAGRVFASDHPGGLLLVGYDTRFQGRAFAEAAAAVLAGHGLRVRVSDTYVPTPALCWSIGHDDEAIGGVIITASHNPARYSGLKLRMYDGGASPVAFTERVEDVMHDVAPTAVGEFETADLMGPYLTALHEAVDGAAIAAARLKVAVDPLFGAGRGYLAGVLRDLGVEVTEVHGEDNPGFGGLHPEPIPPHIDDVRDLVRERGLDAAFITDGDADRIGAADRHGGFVNPHRIICLVARHLVEDKGMTGKIVKTVSTSVLVDRLAAKLGVEVATTPVGFKWIYEEMVAGGVMIGGEESGGIGIPSHVRERDGLLMALLLTEMMARRGMGLGELVDDLIALTGPMEYTRFDLTLEAAAKDAFVASWPALAPDALGGLDVRHISHSDGIKFFFDDDAWLLMRASGTEPLVRIYAEASSAGVVDDLIAAGKALARASS